MKTLHIAIVDKIATYQQRDGEIVCGNNDYVIEFAFDSEWDEHTDKVARFIIGNHYENVSFSGNTCPVPIISNTTSISVGVYAGNLCTTTPAIIGCKKSILCASAAEGKSPILNGDSAYIRYSAHSDGTDFTEEWSTGQGYIGFATGQTAPTTKEGYTWALFTQGTADAELSETSENPIQNKAVAEALKNISVDITVDSELSLESENPIQNKAVTQEFKAFNEAIGDTNRRVSALESGGVGGGVSSWNDLTDKPFGENADGTVKQLDNKYLAILDHQAASENVFLPSYTGTNTYLELNGGISAFMLIPEATKEIYDAWMTNQNDVTVVYDGETYICPIQEFQGMKVAGNISSMGGSGNGEPFALAVIQESADIYMWLIISTVDMAPTEHTVRVYQGMPEKWTIKESCLPFNAIAAYIDNYIDEALGGDY